MASICTVRNTPINSTPQWSPGGVFLSWAFYFYYFGRVTDVSVAWSVLFPFIWYVELVRFFFPNVSFGDDGPTEKKGLLYKYCPCERPTLLRARYSTVLLLSINSIWLDRARPAFCCCCWLFWLAGTPSSDLSKHISQQPLRRTSLSFWSDTLLIL